jgi:hypothetical protein
VTKGRLLRIKQNIDDTRHYQCHMQMGARVSAPSYWPMGYLEPVYSSWSRNDQQRVGPIWLMLSWVINCYLKFSNHNGSSITVPANLHLDWHVHQISFITLAKPALVYTSIHSTVTARYSCGDSLRFDSTCAGRSGSFVVRREWARTRSWDQFSQ